MVLDDLVDWLIQAKAMKQYGVEDRHVFELERRCLEIAKKLKNDSYPPKITESS